MAIEDHENGVNSITNDNDDLQSTFDEMYLELENFG